MSKNAKSRLDSELLRRGLVPSREKARAIIMAGKVSVNGALMDKPGKDVDIESAITVQQDMPYVGRGGLKLEAALEAFKIDPGGLTLMDAGASTGGFTHCLLLRGAATVVAVDVGYGQFHWSLRKDKRVFLLERTNIRFLDREKVPYDIDGAVVDVSFISLKLVLPRLKAFLNDGAWIVALVKPQFEVGREDAKKGVVKDLNKIRSAVDGVKRFGPEIGLKPLGEIESPLRGPKGNREFLVHFKVM